VENNPAWAGYLFRMRQAEFMAPSEPEIQDANDRFMARMGRWLKPQIKAGRLRKLPRDLYAALLFGPCMDFTRQWLSGRARTDPKQAAEVIADAAWRSLATTPLEDADHRR
jgi:hypothetical protein